jgi:predicted negative regulator of RcsB-dependent stress response
VALLAAALGLSVAGCALVSPERGARAEAARVDYEAAREVLETDPAAGKVALEAFVRTWPRSQLADDAALELARIALAEGDTEEALRRLRWVTQAHPKGDRSDAARLLLVRLELSAKRVDAAYSTAQKIRLTRLSEPQRREAYRLNADIEVARGNPIGALRWLSHLRALIEDPDERTVLDAEIDALIASLDEQELERAAVQMSGRPPVGRLWLRRADLAISAGDVERAERVLARAQNFELEPHDTQYLANLEARLLGRTEIDVENAPGTAGASGTLGVVLPLSGPFARFGDESLRGVLLAGGRRGPLPGARRTRRRDRGSAALGRVGGRRARRRGRGNPAARAHAARGRGGRPALRLPARRDPPQRFAILYPDDRYGRGVKNLFWDAVEARGGRIVGVGRYEADADDFAAPIRGLVGYTLITNAEKEAIRERDKLRRTAKRLPPEEATEVLEAADAMLGPNDEPLPPIVDFDVLFVPDSHSKVVLIAPQLAFHEVGTARLFGATGWSHPDLLRIGGRHVEGAVFVEAFHPDDGFRPARQFAERYRETFGSEPGEQAAAAYDAANLVLVQLVRGLRARSDVRNGLLSTRAYPGVSGNTTILSDGNAQKNPYLLGIESGEIISLDAPR